MPAGRFIRKGSRATVTVALLLLFAHVQAGDVPSTGDLFWLLAKSIAFGFAAAAIPEIGEFLGRLL